MITGEGFCHFTSKCLGLLLGYRRDNRHSSMRSAFPNDPVYQKDKAIIDVGDMGFLHIQRQLQLAFKELTTLFTDGFGVRLRPFDDDDKVIGIATVRDSGFPFPILSNRDRATLLDAEVPGPAILSR